ncbi:hypothetical protein [Metapseudomonas otitidis]|uniref:hypothetical protein n=1 Tax=Metapseudomonas otitidis TaxID=319939 RepID=UPI001F17C071|nr:hypothetical protein [Pseudomonas otitidis]
MPNQVEFSEHFTELYDDLSEAEQELIDDFVFHFREHGLAGFKGKRGPTDNVPHIDPDRINKIWWANRHKLWHVHIGYPAWRPSRNPLGTYHTSDFVVHFQKFSESYIALVDYGSHNPMRMPGRESLFKR